MQNSLKVSVSVSVIITGCIAQLGCSVMAVSRSYRTRQNLTLSNFILIQLIITKLNTIDYVSDPYPFARFSLNLVEWEIPYQLVTSNLTVTFVAFFFELLA